MTVYDTALAWHDSGACILPAASDGTKRPALEWAGYRVQRPSREQVAAWAATSPGIGMVCGAVSGGVEMLELEGAAVEAGLHLELRRLVEAAGHADLWDRLQTYVEITPKGGLHWIFRVDGRPVAGNTKLAKRPRIPTADNPAKVETLIETRGEGGWTVLAPSNGATHETGRPWQLVVGHPGRVPTLTAGEVDTLHRLATTFDEMPDLPPAAEPRQAARTPGELTPGDDYNRRTDWADLLVPQGWTHVDTRGRIRYWRRPGKKISISATTGYGDTEHDLLYVFTTSTEFDAERSYTKFGAHTMLEHHGDFAAAARSLRGQGYGGPRPDRDNPLTLIHGSQADNVSDETPPLITAPAADVDLPSWDRIDLSAHLDGTHVPQTPELLHRADGERLLYRGRVHSFHGESESGKSWVALAAAAEQLERGHDVLMLDFESDAHTVVGRLLRLGITPAAIATHFDYRRPETSPALLAREHEAWASLLTRSYTVAILDGVTEALAVYGVTSKDNDEVTQWIRTTPRRVAAATGAAVILVDHVTKDADSRGRFAIGGQAKMAALDGAAYVVEVLEPLGVGLAGRVALRVAKDRPGGIRPHAGAWRKSDRTQEAAVVVIDSTEDDVTTVQIEQPRGDLGATDDGAQPFRPTGLMERVSRFLENANAAVSRTGLGSSVRGRRDYILQAVDCLIIDGYAAADGPSLNGGKPTIRLITPYREGGRDPFPDLDPTDLVPEDSEVTPTRSLSTTGERGNGSGSPLHTRSGNGSGTGRERVGVTDSDAPSPESEESSVLLPADLTIPPGNGSGTGRIEGKMAVGLEAGQVVS